MQDKDDIGCLIAAIVFASILAIIVVHGYG